MDENFKKFGLPNIGSDDDLKPFIGKPEGLPQAEREELVFRFKYHNETVEFLAIEYRLTPSLLARWLEENNISPVDLNNDEELEKLEKSLERQKRINAVRLTGSILTNMNTAWNKIARTEQILLTVIESTAKSMIGFEVVDPKSVSALTKAHNTMVTQQLEIKAVAEESDNLGNLTGLLSKRLESIFKEIDNIGVI